MDIRTFTTETVLGDANPNKLAPAIQKAGLASALHSLGTPVEETLAVDATFKCTLSKIPLPGSIRAARKTGGYLTQTEVHNACTLAQGQFSVDYTTGEVTFETTDLNDADEVVFIYTGLVGADSGTGTALAAALAEQFES